VRVLLDENVPHDLIAALVGHSISTVQGLGWDGTKNGALLKRASGLIDAFVTIDGNCSTSRMSLSFRSGSWLSALCPIACRTSCRSFRKYWRHWRGFNRAQSSRSAASEAAATT